MKTIVESGNVRLRYKETFAFLVGNCALRSEVQVA